MSEQSPATLDYARSRQKLDLASTVHQIRAKTGSSVGFLPEWMKLNVGQGRILFNEYLEMRLWDPEFCARSDLKEFVGNWGMRRIWKMANFVPGVQVLATNKIAASAILEAYGLSVPHQAGLHAVSVVPGHGRTSTPEALESFLLQDLSYPAFGKPLSGNQSLGSVSLNSRDASSGMLVGQDGKKIAAKALAHEIHDNYATGGYIFQSRLIPHEAVRAVCGERTATVRVLTIAGSQGPSVFRACWKIPAGANGVDNFWRPGNLLASLNLEDGTIRRVVCGSGLAMTEVDQHPDTHTRLLGMKVPLWEEICAAALAGAAAMSDFGLLGWDIAATSSGAVIVEVNDTPDVVMHQITDRRGILESAFQRFMEERRQARNFWNANIRAAARKEYSPSVWFSPLEK